MIGANASCARGRRNGEIGGIRCVHELINDAEPVVDVIQGLLGAVVQGLEASEKQARDDGNPECVVGADISLETDPHKAEGMTMVGQGIAVMLSTCCFVRRSWREGCYCVWRHGARKGTHGNGGIADSRLGEAELRDDIAEQICREPAAAQVFGETSTGPGMKSLS